MDDLPLPDIEKINVNNRSMPMSPGTPVIKRNPIMSPEPVKHTNDLSTDQIEVMLKLHHYTPVHTTTVDYDGKTEHFIKALSPSGAHVLIDINVHGILPVSRADIKVTPLPSDKSLGISLSSKTGGYSCSNDVDGVAFETPEGMCTLTRDEKTFDVNEKQFIKVSHVMEESAVVGTDSVAIPVVRLNEILESPRLTDERITRTTQKIFISNFNRCYEDISKINEVICSVNKDFNMLDNNMRVAAQNLCSSITELNGYHKAYTNCANKNSQTESKHRNVVKELEMRYALYRKLIRICNANKEKYSELLQLKAFFDDTNQVILKDYSNLSNILNTGGGSRFM